MGLLRFLLAFSVVFEHVGETIPYHLIAGHAAVQSFYMISGFYMALVLNEKYAAGKKGYQSFMVSRVFRLFPAYLTILFLTVAAQIVFRTVQGPQDDALGHWLSDLGSVRPAARFFIALPNLTLVGLDAHQFFDFDRSSGAVLFAPHIGKDGLRMFEFVPQAWTLGVELLFYLVAPWIVRKSWKFLAALLVGSVALRVIAGLVLHWYKDPWLYRFFPFELAFFVAGAIGYHAYASLRKSDRPYPILSIAALVVVLGFTVTYLLFPAYKVDLIYYPVVAITIPFVFNLTKRWKWDRFIGELSYPIYISHILLIYVVTQLSLSEWLVPPLVLAVSILLFWFVDRPVDAFRHRLTLPMLKTAAA